MEKPKKYNQCIEDNKNKYYEKIEFIQASVIDDKNPNEEIIVKNNENNNLEYEFNIITKENKINDLDEKDEESSSDKDE